RVRGHGGPGQRVHPFHGARAHPRLRAHRPAAVRGGDLPGGRTAAPAEDHHASPAAARHRGRVRAGVRPDTGRVRRPAHAGRQRRADDDDPGLHRRDGAVQLAPGDGDGGHPARRRAAHHLAADAARPYPVGRPMSPAARLGRLAFGALIVALCLFFLAPMLVVCYLAFSPVGFFKFPVDSLSLQWFSRLWQTPALLESFYRSLVLAAVVVPVTGVLAVASALALRRSRFRGRAVLDAMFSAPIVVPSLVIGVALLQVYAAGGLTDTWVGVLAAHVVVTFPYFLRAVYVRLATRQDHLEEAAESLGADPWRVIRTVTVPSTLPGIVSE